MRTLCAVSTKGLRAHQRECVTAMRALFQIITDAEGRK